MAQLVCGGCHTLLMYIRGATSVQCSCCHTVNLAMEGSTNETSIYFSSSSGATSIFHGSDSCLQNPSSKRIYSVVRNSSNKTITF